jgi:hypothetical protein
MKAALSFLAVALTLTALLLLGCVPGLQSAKPAADGDAFPPPEQADGAKAPAPSEPGADQATPPPPPQYIPPPPPDREKISEATMDLRMKDEVNEAAMRFAKEFPNVTNVKTCYSKLYGGWYLFLYHKKGKGFVFDQFSWNAKSREWEPAGQFKVPGKLEQHLKGEVADEKCSVLK